MAERDANNSSSSVDGLPATGMESAVVDAAEYELAFGEPLSRTLDLGTWEVGENLAALYCRLEEEIEAAVQQENRIRGRVREEIFPRLRTRPGAPCQAGVYAAKVREVEMIHRGFLFNGRVEACDGTSVMHDTLPITIAQIGVCLVSYHGSEGAWVHRLYRRDLRMEGLDPVSETLEILERRRDRSGLGTPSRRDTLSNLARRGIMDYAERAALLHKSEAIWRMGHGHPTPWQLLTGSGMRDLLKSSLEMMSELVLGHRRFVFVPSSPAARFLLTIGNALQPLEFAIVDTVTDSLRRIYEAGHYRGEGWDVLGQKVKEFVEEVGSRIVVGVYRASAMAPAQVFYAHQDHAHEAALVALADSVLQEHRGFPMLIDLADNLCRATFGAESFAASTQLAYVEAGEPFRYLSERSTRR
jgi:hypothetical protein